MVLMNWVAWLSAFAFCHSGGKHGDGTKDFSQSLCVVCFNPRFVHFYLFMPQAWCLGVGKRWQLCSDQPAKRSSSTDSTTSFKAALTSPQAAIWNVLSCCRDSNILSAISGDKGWPFWTTTGLFFFLAMPKCIWKKVYFQPVELWLLWHEDK